MTDEVKVAGSPVTVVDGVARAKKAFEEGQVPGNRGQADDGVPSAEANSAVNARARKAGLASVVDSQAIRDKHSVESHERMAKVIATDDKTRLGFDINDHRVKYVNGEKPPEVVTGPAKSSVTPAATPLPPPVVVP